MVSINLLLFIQALNFNLKLFLFVVVEVLNFFNRQTNVLKRVPEPYEFSFIFISRKEWSIEILSYEREISGDLY